MEFHERLKIIRKEKGLTQKEVADRVGTSVRIIQHYELGTRKPGLEMLEALCYALQISADILLDLHLDDQ